MIGVIRSDGWWRFACGDVFNKRNWKEVILAWTIQFYSPPFLKSLSYSENKNFLELFIFTSVGSLTTKYVCGRRRRKKTKMSHWENFQMFALNSLHLALHSAQFMPKLWKILTTPVHWGSFSSHVVQIQGITQKNKRRKFDLSLKTWVMTMTMNQ